MQCYCEKLVWNASKKLGPRPTLMLARKFMKHYGLNKHIPPSSLIEFLLSTPDDDTTTSCDRSKAISEEAKTTNQLEEESNVSELQHLIDNLQDDFRIIFNLFAIEG